MPSTFEKPNLKNQRQIVVLNAPESFEQELAALRDVTILRNLQDLTKVANGSPNKDVDDVLANFQPGGSRPSLGGPHLRA